jgi:hypothetical protein
MIKVIRFLLGLCDHKWVVLRTGNVVSGNSHVGFWTYSSCDKCGKRKYKQQC